MAKRPGKTAALAHARALLQKIILADGHNDVPWVIRTDAQARGDVAKFRFDKKLSHADVDIPKMRAGLVSAQVHAAYLPTDIAHPATVTLEQIDIIHQIERLHADVFLPVRQVSDIAKAKRQGKIASITSVEGGVGLEGSLSPLRQWYALGMRGDDALPQRHAGLDRQRNRCEKTWRPHGLWPAGRARIESPWRACGFIAWLTAGGA